MATVLARVTGGEWDVSGVEETSHSLEGGYVALAHLIVSANLIERNRSCFQVDHPLYLRVAVTHDGILREH